MNMLNRIQAPARTVAVEEPEQGFNPRDIINFVWRQWKIIAGIATLMILIGAVYLARQIPMYTATAQVLLDPRKEKAAGQDNVLGDATFDLPAIESQMAIIRSSVLLQRIVEKERLVTDPEFGAAPASAVAGLFGSLRTMFSSAPDLRPTAGPSSSAQVAAAVENLKAALTVSRAGQAYVLTISTTSSDPTRAARLANAVADGYVVDKLDARFEAARRASGWLSERLEDLRKQLRESEQAVAQFRSDNDLVQSNNNTTLNQEQLGQLNARLVSVRADTAEKKARLDLLQRIQAGGGNVQALPELMASGAIADLRKQDTDLSRQEADLLARYNDRHPTVVNIRAQRRDIQRAIGAEVGRLAANVRNDYELSKARQDAVEKTLREVTGETDVDATKAITLRELERTASVNKTLFEDFLQRARVTQEQSTFEARRS
jgi:succinoglycan biosynthesis transport protein ExoP